jgi:predicted restriction endonuclease
LRTGELPDNGGEPAQLTVTVPFDAVTGELRRGLLDIGRQRRLYSGPIRRALAVRDQGCAFPDCDRPTQWCDAHHIVSWLEGGATSVANGVLLCRRHHRLIHDGEWVVRMGADDVPEFVPPAHVDPKRLPRRNIFHRRT